jgi:predicted CoA-substrate-specific enzyme activase
MDVIAGVDIGAASTKVVLLDERRKIVGRLMQPSGSRLDEAGQKGLEAALAKANLPRGDVRYIAATGYGRYQLSVRDIQITDMTCHARGAFELFDGVNTVVDIGAQNTRAMSLRPDGRVARFKMSERCAAGAGRFLERVARALEMEMDELSPAGMRSTDPQPISSICAVLAESEIINLVTEGRRVEDIIQGANESIADRIVALVRQVGAKPEIAITGMISKNQGTLRAIEERLKVKLLHNDDSPIAGALGAALLGQLRLERLGEGHGEPTPAGGAAG